MKIMWIVNIIFPYPASKIGMEKSVFGGWLNSLFKKIKESNEISEIAVATIYNGEEVLKFKDDNVIYYLLPSKQNLKYDKNLEKYWKDIYNEFSPDLVHIHGTEYPFALGLLKAVDNIKSVVSIQGLTSVCGDKNIYNAGISIGDMLKNVTLRDILKRDFLFLQYKKFQKRGNYEKKILSKANYIIGRTDWDRSHAYEITKSNNYFFCNESLRESFFNVTWDLEKVSRHTIFVSQATYPIKGFHKIIEATNLLKPLYPDLKVYVAGEDIIKSKNNDFKSKMKLSGYGMYLKRLIKKYNLQDNICFLGLLTEQEMCDRLMKSHVFVQASSIENSPNSLGEAMLVGMPCVASYVGGTANLLLDKKEGYLYPFNDYTMMAEYIKNIFENDDLAKELGTNAHIHASKTHDIETNYKKMLEIYNNIVKKGK